MSIIIKFAQQLSESYTIKLNKNYMQKFSKTYSMAKSNQINMSIIL